MKQLFIFKTNSFGNGYSVSKGHFRLHPGFKLSFEQNSVLKNLFLNACFCWDSRLPLREMHKKFIFGSTIGNSDSCVEFLFRHFKVFKLHDKLHGVVYRTGRAHSGKSPGFCYMIGWGPNPCLLRHVITLLPLRKLPFALLFWLCRLSKQYVLQCISYWAGKWKRN